LLRSSRNTHGVITVASQNAAKQRFGPGAGDLLGGLAAAGARAAGGQNKLKRSPARPASRPAGCADSNKLLCFNYYRDLYSAHNFEMMLESEALIHQAL